MKKILLSTVAALAFTASWCQPRYDMKRISRERLDRGIVALRQSDGSAVVTWRTLMSDRKGEPFDIYPVSYTHLRAHETSV